jgi:hypothetical protein
MSSNLKPEMTFKKLVFLHMQQLTNFPYIEKDFDALTDYELLCLVVKFLNDVIKNSNDQNESILNLYNAFIELQNYVNEYFDEKFPELVNNKLDEMAEDGTLENIIAKYINSNMLIVVTNVENLKKLNLTNGQKVKTLGYYNENDGGNGLYYIKETEPTSYYEELDNGMFAELIIENNTINVLQVGAKNDNETDNTTYFNKAITQANNHNNIIYIPSGKYVIENTLETINSGISITGDKRSVGVTENKSYIVDKRNSDDYLIKYTNSTLGTSISNLTFEAYSENNSDNIKCIYARYGFYMGFIENCDFVNYPVAINIQAHVIRVNNCQFHLCGGKTSNSSFYAITITNGMDVLIENCCSDHCRYIINSIGSGKIKIINSHWELSTALLTAGNSPIRLENSFGATLENNTFVNLSVNAWKEIIGLSSQQDVPYMVYTSPNAYSIIANNTFLCGTGSGGYDTDITNEAKYLYMARGIINGNIFQNCSYVVPSIAYEANVLFDNNRIEVVLKTDYSYTNKYVISNGGGNGGENNHYFIEQQDASADYDFPWLFYYYVKHTISSTASKYLMNNENVTTNSNCLTYVFKSNQRTVANIYLNSHKINSYDLLFNGLIGLTTASPAARQIFHKSFSNDYSLVISYKDNKVYFQFIGSNLNNFITSFDGFKGIFGELYLDTTITEQITADNQLIINS